MQFGLFCSPKADSGALGPETGQGFRDFLDFNVEAEALGLYSSFSVEHHFTGWNQISATPMLLTALAMRTTTLRLGTAVLVLPWHNPVLLAEQAATLDLLSGGRLDFGVGKGYRYNEFAGFAMPMAEADARFDESMAVITKAFTSNEKFSHKGKFWQFDNVIVEPPPAARPHPPFWMGAGSERSVRQVAERGYNLLLGQYDLLEDVVRHVAQFKQDVAARGREYDPMEVGIARAVHFADTPEELEAAQVRRLQGHVRINKLAEKPGDDRERFVHNDAEMRKLCDATAIFGTPDQIARKLETLRDGGAEYVIVNFGGAIKNIRRFAREIMPHFAGEPRHP